MFCEKCGSKVADGVKFCEKCGAAVKTTAQITYDDRTVGFAQAFPNQTLKNTTWSADTSAGAALNINDESTYGKFIVSKVPAYEAKGVYASMTKILPSYSEGCDLRSMILLSNPVSLARSLYSQSNDALFCIISAVNGYLMKENGDATLIAFRKGIVDILKERIRRGELNA